MNSLPEFDPPASEPGHRWVSASILVFAGWIPAAALAAYLRWTVLNINGGGFEFVAESLHTNASALPWYQELALFRGDLLVAGLLVPAALLLVTRPLSRPSMARLALLLGLLTQLLLFVQLKVFWDVGAFLPLSVLVTGITSVGRQFAGEYTAWASVVKFGGLLSASLVIFYLAWRWEARAAPAGTARRRVVNTLWAGLACLTGAAWTVSLPPSPYQSSTLVEIIRASSGLSREFQGQVQVPIEREALLQAYRSLTNAPVPNGPTSYAGRARGSDVIMLVLETTPAACLDLSAPDALPPTMRSLAHHSFLGLNHYSTYPFTERAIFSIFSSWYPSNHPESFVKILDRVHPQLLAPGIARSTQEAGYFTALFAPDPVENWVHEDVAYRALGFSTWFVPPSPTPGTDSSWSTMSRRDRAFVKDTLTLTLLKDQIAQAVHGDRRYLFTYLPQYTHGPWPHVTSHSTSADVLAQCGPLLSVIDGWLGQVTGLLTRLGTLDRTVIVIVGDHGLRTRLEHPSFVAGSLSDISFHVPLMIYAPMVLDSTVRIPWLTSHIDISPSVLDLLGLESGRGLEQGSPIWSAALQTRKTFFFARNYLGADGYYSQGSACMYKYAIESAICAPWTGELRFSLGDFNVMHPGLADSVRAEVGQMTALQDRWSEVMIPAAYDRVLGTSRHGR
jgi:hypothetical protein